MHTNYPLATARVAGYRLHAALVPFPIVCFIGAFITDLAYWSTVNIIWETFSDWLLLAGLVIAAFAVIAGLIDFVRSRRIRSFRSSWLHVVCNIIVLGLSIVNAFVHSRDGYTAVVPTGLILSGIVTVLILLTAWLGRDMVYRHNIGAIE